MTLTKQGVRDLSSASYAKMRVVPTPGQSVSFETKTENPDHESLVARFDQLERLLDGILHSRPAAQNALRIVRLIRAQVLK